MLDGSFGRPHSPVTSPLTMSQLFPLAYLLAPLNASFSLQDMPWVFDEEQSYHDSQRGGFPSWQVTLLDAIAALCTLQSDCSSVCVCVSNATQLLVSLPHPGAAQLKKAIGRCLAELQPLSEHGHGLPRSEAAPLEDKFIVTAYGTCHSAHREVVRREVVKVLAQLNSAIKGAEGLQEREEGQVKVVCAVDGRVHEDECDEPDEERAIERSDIPRLQELCQALSDLLLAVHMDEDNLTLYARGITVLAHVDDRDLVPVLRGIEYSLHLNVVRNICALPWTVHTLMHIARSSTLLEPPATLPTSVTWIHPLPSHSPPSPLSLPSTEELVATLQAVSPEMSRDDCVAVIKEGFECLEACRRRNNSSAGDIHAEAVLIHHIVSNKIDVYPYLATSPIAFSWSCYACARLLDVVNAERQLRLTLRGCSDTMILPSSLPTFGEDIDAALLAQLRDDVRALAVELLNADKYDPPVREPISFKQFIDSEDSSPSAHD
ncbi:hypothetical protein K466DRAFT_661364 [Polyporus arcularius HHB13444]|uniref:Uncharacterized protein n=1 Tax=Polyporus arcularius HHB13444 TaxID=1314778 RepID=A0A5C3PKW2_9APHY|nr:hypothetical protein K466DRAFT_661364 [Polyporus arcularius HHB13444]